MQASLLCTCVEGTGIGLGELWSPTWTRLGLSAVGTTGGGRHYGSAGRGGGEKKPTKNKIVPVSHCISPDCQWRVRQEKSKVPD